MVSPVEYVGQTVRRERSWVGLSLSELARRAGLAKSTLSQLEAGRSNPLVKTLWILSTVLDVPFSSLVVPPEPAARLLRARDGTTTRAENAEYSAMLLSPNRPDAERDLYRILAQPGADRLSDPHAAGTAEHVIIMTGCAIVGPIYQSVELNPGDYLEYPGDVPHLFRALKPDTTAVMVLETFSSPNNPRYTRYS